MLAPPGLSVHFKNHPKNKKLHHFFTALQNAPTGSLKAF
jgi:hypothetical protein